LQTEKKSPKEETETSARVQEEKPRNRIDLANKSPERKIVRKKGEKNGKGKSSASSIKEREEGKAEKSKSPYWGGKKGS